MKSYFIEKDNQKRLITLDLIIRKARSKGVTRKAIIDMLKGKSFQASLSTFNRDVKRLRDDLHAPLVNEYGKDRDGNWAVLWRYTDPSWTLSDVSLTEGDLFGLLVAQRVMEQYEGLPTKDDLQKIFDCMADKFNRLVTVQHETLLPISFSSERPDPVKPEIWKTVAKAAMQHQRLKISYTNIWGNESGDNKPRNVAPYHIVNLQGVWYLLATAGEKDDSLRQYALSRITRATMLNHHFTIPDSFDIDKLLEITFGQFIGDPAKIEEIHLRFKKCIAPLIKSRHFSRTEQRNMLPSGDIELKFKASSAGPYPFMHIKSWVLSWGSDVEVLGPPRLAKLVNDEIRKMAGQESFG